MKQQRHGGVPGHAQLGRGVAGQSAAGAEEVAAGLVEGGVAVRVVGGGVHGGVVGRWKYVVIRRML